MDRHLGLLGSQLLRRISKLLALTFLCLLVRPSCLSADPKPKVIVITDINIGKGDPDDRQSLTHLLWYADQLQIEAIIPDRWDEGRGKEACDIAIEAYAQDYEINQWSTKGFADPELIKKRVIIDKETAIERINEIITNSAEAVYILIWGNMLTLSAYLQKYPESIDQLRVISIGTGLKYGPRDEVPGEDCNVPNWNGAGRNQIFNDTRFNQLWWIEMNWTYNGMFMGEGPKQMFKELSRFGAMGRNIVEVTEGYSWAKYFRVGDTPSVLYLIDKKHDLEDPTEASWSGKFKQAFPKLRPNYFTDDNGNIEWDYESPCKTWSNLEAMYAYNKQTLFDRKEEMYRALLDKLKYLYNQK